MQVLMRIEGYHTEIAHDCKTAVALLTNARPGLILLDYLLQNETCEHVVFLAKRDGIPTILVSAYSKADEVGQQLHLEAVVKKPFTIESLTSLVGTLYTKPNLKSLQI